MHWLKKSTTAADLQVHDELFVRGAGGRGQGHRRVIKAIMQGACAPHCELSVPLVVETGWTPKLGRGALGGSSRSAESSESGKPEIR
jgi:DNA polymerase I-like protein with 3'-5' exonuclease and polymerase domains